jgi:choline kinase
MTLRQNLPRRNVVYARYANKVVANFARHKDLDMCTTCGDIFRKTNKLKRIAIALLKMQQDAFTLQVLPYPKWNVEI